MNGEWCDKCGARLNGSGGSCVYLKRGWRSALFSRLCRFFGVRCEVLEW